MFGVVGNPECACPPMLLNSTMFGGVWRIDTAGNMSLWDNVGAVSPSLVSGDHLLLWGDVTETANFTILTSISIGSVYPGRQSQANWSLAGFTADVRADVTLNNLHIAGAEDIIVSTTAGLTLNFVQCFLVLSAADFSPDAAFNSAWFFKMENCFVTGVPGVTEFLVGVPNGTAVVQVRDTEFRDIETHFISNTGALRFYGTQFFNNDSGNFYSCKVGGTGNKFFQSCRFYGRNNSAIASVGIFHVEAGTDDLRLSNCQIRAKKGADTGYGVVFEAVNITNVIFANTWAQDAGPVTSMLYCPPAGITIRGPNSTFDGAAFVNVTVNP